MMFFALVSAVIWLGLLLFWGRFWRADQRLAADCPAPPHWPEVVAVIPARNEADTIGQVLAAHGASTYPGRLSVILVDDSSTDSTGEIARTVASPRPIHVIVAPEIKAGWTGKLWALETGTSEIGHLAPDAAYVLLTDADILHTPMALQRLVAKAEADGLGLTSLMARLDCRGFWGRLLIPAFIFFFQKLYPFPWVNDRARKMAAAAGGCVLLRRDALARIGGIAAIRSALIDDCTLARRVKEAGFPIFLGLAGDEVVSLRDNRDLASVWTMVARTAFTQLHHSYGLLAGSTLGMALLYLAGPIGLALAVTGTGHSVIWPLAAWGLSALAYWPTVRLYGLSPGYALLLPVAALIYMMMTLDSARQHWLGRGGAWKGRTYPPA